MSQELPPSNGDRNFGIAIEAVAIASCALSVIIVALRIFIRIKLRNNLGWDDFWMVLSTIVSIPGMIFVVLSVKYGLGRHEYYLSPSKIPNIIKWNTAFQLDNSISTTFTKLSIYVFIRRIKNTGWISWATNIGIVMTVILGVFSEIALGAQCIPLEGLWNSEVSAWCYKTGTLAKMSYAQGSLNALLDLGISLSPMVILWNIQMRPRKKVAISGLMSLGLIATGMNITRAVLLKDVNTDVTYQLSGVAIAAILEQNLGIITACIPTLQPLFRDCLERSRSQKYSSNPNTLPIASDRKRSQVLDQSIPYSSKNYNVIVHSHRKSDESSVPLQDLPTSDQKIPVHGIFRKMTYDIEYGRRTPVSE